MKKTFWGLLLLMSILLQSCDAVLILAYQVKNGSGRPIRLKIKNYGTQALFTEGRDTIITLNPGETFIVGRSLPDIGFPGEEKLIYYDFPSCNNFSLVQGDSIVAINPANSEWKYGSGCSTYNITKKSLSDHP